jgi:hypothetical protein
MLFRRAYEISMDWIAREEFHFAGAAQSFFAGVGNIHGSIPQGIEDALALTHRHRHSAFCQYHGKVAIHWFGCTHAEAGQAQSVP